MKFGWTGLVGFLFFLLSILFVVILFETHVLGANNKIHIHKWKNIHTVGVNKFRDRPLINKDLTYKICNMCDIILDCKTDRYIGDVESKIIKEDICEENGMLVLKERIDTVRAIIIKETKFDIIFNRSEMMFAYDHEYMKESESLVSFRKTDRYRMLQKIREELKQLREELKQEGE